MTGRQLLADEPDRRGPSGSNVCQARGKSAVVRAAADRQVPAPRRQRVRAAASDRTWLARPPSARSTNSENPSAATGSKRCRPTSRCQRAKSPRCVRPMLPVPRPPIGTPPQRAVVDHRRVHPRTARRSAYGYADAPPPRGRRDPASGRRVRPSLVDAGHDDAAHERALGEEEHDDRHRHGHQRRRLDERGLRHVQRVVLLDGDRQRLQLGLARQVQERQEEVVPRVEEVEQA